MNCWELVSCSKRKQFVAVNLRPRRCRNYQATVWPGREAAHWIWTGCGSMVWFLDVYTQFSTARGDQCQQRKNLAPNRKSSRRVIWTGDPCETDTILTSMVEANAFTLQGWGRLASLC